MSEPSKIEVVVDRSLEVEKERSEKEALKKELEELKRKTFEAHKKAVGCEDPEIETEEQLNGWIKAKEEERLNRKSASGSALYTNARPICLSRTERQVRTDPSVAATSHRPPATIRRQLTRNSPNPSSPW